MRVIKKVTKFAAGAVLFGGTALLPGLANASGNASCLSWFELISKSSHVSYKSIKCTADKAIVENLYCKATQGSCKVKELMAAKPFPGLKIEIAKNVKEINPDGYSYTNAVYYTKGENFANINIDNLELDIKGQVKLLFPVLTAGMMESSSVPKGVDATKIVIGSANGVLQVLTAQGQASELRPMDVYYMIFYNEKKDEATVFGNVNWQDYLTIKVKAYLKNVHSVLQGVQNAQMPRSLNQINIGAQMQNKIFQIVPEKLVFTVSVDNELLNAIKSSPDYQKWLAEWEARAKSNDIVGEFAKGIVQILKGQKDSITVEFKNKTNANLAQMLSMVLTGTLTQNIELMKALLENQFEMHVYVR